MLESTIKSTLTGDLQTTALNFASFLSENNLTFKDGAVRHQDKVICYMHLDNGEEMPSPWTIWTEGDYSSEPASAPLTQHTKETAQANVNICASCGGSCNPGQQKVIFGKTFENVCSADMAFYRPSAETLECIKHLLLMRKNND